MSQRPRIVFTRFLSRESPKLAPWVAHLDQVVASARPLGAPASADDGAIVWHLVSANNRHLARSVAIHPSFADAETDAREVIAAGARLYVELVSQPQRGSYGWFVSDGGAPVMLCARWYLTPRDRQHAIDLALRSLGDADLHPGVRLIHSAPEGAPEPYLA